MKLNSAIQNRWSPRKFSDKPVTEKMITLLFEAARMAPSARNEQPWSYFYVHRNNKNTFDNMTKCLTGNNPVWSSDAQLLIISVYKKNYKLDNRLNKNALHDLGAANMSIAIQAAEMGFQVHPMAGFDKEKVLEFLQLDPETCDVPVMFAVGYPDVNEPLSEETKQIIQQHKSRKELEEFVIRLF